MVSQWATMHSTKFNWSRLLKKRTKRRRKIKRKSKKTRESQMLRFPRLLVQKNNKPTQKKNNRIVWVLKKYKWYINLKCKFWRATQTMKNQKSRKANHILTQRTQMIHKLQKIIRINRLPRCQISNKTKKIKNLIQSMIIKTINMELQKRKNLQRKANKKTQALLPRWLKKINLKNKVF